MQVREYCQRTTKRKRRKKFPPAERLEQNPQVGVISVVWHIPPLILQPLSSHERNRNFVTFVSCSHDTTLVHFINYCSRLIAQSILI